MKQTTIFWNWFIDNHHTIKNLQNHSPENQETICYWIKQNLNYYCRKIDFIIVFPKRSMDQFEFIITSRGNHKLFKQVIDLVDNAPVIKTWKFTAFITSKETIEKRINKLDQPFIVQDINLKEDKLKSIPITLKKYGKKQTIHIHLKNHTIRCSNKILYQAILTIVEKISRNTILFENIYLVQLPQRPGEQKVLIRLFELQEYVNSFNLKQK
jgi:ribosome-associated translation inhibitor RaiA